MKEIREKIETALKKIPHCLGELFYWRNFCDLSYQEISEMKGKPVGSIKSQIFLSKALLRQHLEGNI